MCDLHGPSPMVVCSIKWAVQRLAFLRSFRRTGERLE